jgi:hypothetical protein
LGERLLCKQEVIGSIPFTSTSGRNQRSGIQESVESARREARPRKRLESLRADP